MTKAFPDTAGSAANKLLTRPNSPILLTALLVITVAFSLYAAGDGTVPGDVWLIQEIQRIESDTLEAAADGMDWLGTAQGTAIPAIVIATWLAWRRWWGFAAPFIVAPLVFSVLNTALKVLLDSPRPTSEIARITGDASGMGFPSGHAMRAMIFYGLVWIIASRLIERDWLRRLVKGLAIAMVVLHGLARIYLGVHWPSDVLGGYLWGGLVLALLITLYDFAATRWPRTEAGTTAS